MSPTELPSKILVVDEDPTVSSSLQSQLAQHRISVFKALDVQSAHYLFNKNRFDVVMVEAEVNGVPGWQLIQNWRNHEFLEKRCTGFIVLAQNRGLESKKKLSEQYAAQFKDVEFSLKPIQESELLSLLSKAMATKERLLANYKRVLRASTRDIVQQKVVPTEVTKNVGNSNTIDRSERQQIHFYEKYGRWRECLEVTLRLLEKAPNDLELLNTACRMHLMMGNYSDAKNFLEKADGLAPHDIAQLRGLADLYLKTKEPLKSVERFKTLVNLTPHAPDLKFDAVRTIAEAGYEDQALKFCQENAQPAEVLRYYNNRGVLLAKVGKVDEALAEYERAIKIFPDYQRNYLIFFNMALAHLKRRSGDDVEKAKEYLRDAIKIEPTFDKAKTLLDSLRKPVKPATKQAI